MSSRSLRTGERAIVHFRFIKYPEYLKMGQRLVFREGRTKAVGNVIKMIPLNEQLGVNIAHKSQKASKILSSLQQNYSEVNPNAETESSNTETFNSFTSINNERNATSKHKKKHSVRNVQGKT